MKTGIDELRARMEGLLSRRSAEEFGSETAAQSGRLSKRPVPWALQEWRESAIPAWRAKLDQSIKEGDQSKELEARWMLGEVLEDTEYPSEEV